MSVLSLDDLVELYCGIEGCLQPRCTVKAQPRVLVRDNDRRVCEVELGVCANHRHALTDHVRARLLNMD